MVISVLQIKVYITDLVLPARSPQTEARWARTVWATSGRQGPPANTKALAQPCTAATPAQTVRTFLSFFFRHGLDIDVPVWAIYWLHKTDGGRICKPINRSFRIH